MPTFLPYHCPRLHGDFFKSPCAGKIIEAESYRDKFPNGMMGSLEHCLTCQGKDLVIREEPAEATVKENLTVQKEAPMAQVQVTAPDHIPAAVRGLIKGQFCKHHPETESHKNKNGIYTGLCRECLAARASRNSRMRGRAVDKKDMTPAVARDLGKKPATRSVSSLGGSDPEFTGEQSTEAYIAEMRGRPLEVCAKHKLPIKFNPDLNPLEVIFTDFPDEWAWLREYSREQVRSPEQQLVFMLRKFRANIEGAADE